jgi:hypothetical protein
MIAKNELKIAFETPSIDDVTKINWVNTVFSFSKLSSNHALELFPIIIGSIQRFLKEFSSCAIPQLGFNSFCIDDVLDFLMNDNQFEFRLKRPAGVLYGRQHAAIRQSLINNLPAELRLPLVRSKLSALFSSLSVFPLFSFHQDGLVIEDAYDIGMGHSVYLVKVNIDGIARNYVFKQEELQHQVFHCNLLKELKLADFKTFHFTGTKCLEISQYLGPVVLTTVVTSKNQNKIEKFEKQLARHAAFGDILGRGDRHLENYVVLEDEICPIDVSFLFDKENESWTRKYVMAGMYEICLLISYCKTPEILADKIKVFFDNYQDYYLQLRQQINSIEAHIISFYGTDQHTGTMQKIEFIRARLFDESYFNAQRQLYLESFFIMLRRLVYKDVLGKLATDHPKAVESYPVLKMYFLADQDRLSCFYLLETELSNTFQDIELLANKYLKLDKSYFELEIQKIDQLEKNICNVYMA